MTILLGLDIGTTGARALAIAADGAVVAEVAALVCLRPERDKPDPANLRADAEYAAVYRDLYRALLGATGRLAMLVSA